MRLRYRQQDKCIWNVHFNVSKEAWETKTKSQVMKRRYLIKLCPDLAVAVGQQLDRLPHSADKTYLNASANSIEVITSASRLTHLISKSTIWYVNIKGSV